MRIGILCHATFGGSARVATQLATHLAERGHTVHLFTRTTPFGHWDDGNGATLHTITPNHEDKHHPASLLTDWPAQELQALLACVLGVIAAEGLDVLHFHYGVPFASLAAQVKRRLGQAAPKLVGTLHGTDVSVHGRDPVQGPHLAQVLPQMDWLTTVSVSHARLADALFELPASPEVIPNSVDLSTFRPRENGGNAGRRARIVHISNFRPIKDPESMARLFLDIRGHIEAELWLIGEGPKLEAVRAILEHSSFADDVRYWGLQRDVVPLLARCHLLLMTSVAESFCLVALEAMACGVPVLSTNVGGLPEVVIDGETGFLFRVGDHDSAVRLAINLLSDPARHRDMRQAAVRHARRFGHEQIMPAYEDLYQRLLQ